MTDTSRHPQGGRGAARSLRAIARTAIAVFGMSAGVGVAALPAQAMSQKVSQTGATQTGTTQTGTTQTGTTRTGAAQGTAALTCKIRSRARAGGTELTGVIDAPVALRGEYRFLVSSRGSGGVSNVSQGGAFRLRPGTPTIVGPVIVNSGSGTRISAHLTIRTSGGESCETRK